MILSLASSSCLPRPHHVSLSLTFLRLSSLSQSPRASICSECPLYLGNIKQNNYHYYPYHSFRDITSSVQLNRVPELHETIVTPRISRIASQKFYRHKTFVKIEKGDIIKSWRFERAGAPRTLWFIESAKCWNEDRADAHVKLHEGTIKEGLLPVKIRRTSMHGLQLA